MPALLGGAHVANTTAYELAAWAGLALVVARIGRTGDCRWWLAGCAERRAWPGGPGYRPGTGGRDDDMERR